MPTKLSNALTPLSVANAKPGRHTDGNGLQLLVKPTGARSWVLRYYVDGKAREMGLGPADGAGAVSLRHARDLAAAQRLAVSGGLDPLAERHRMAAEARAAGQASLSPEYRSRRPLRLISPRMRMAGAMTSTGRNGRQRWRPMFILSWGICRSPV